jgi:hypothetical protein
MFDPAKKTAKKAISALSGLSDDELAVIRDAEAAGKSRKSLLAEIDRRLASPDPEPERAREDDGTFVADDPATPENEAFVGLEPEPDPEVPVRRISVKDWFRLNRGHRKQWVRDGRDFREK